MTERDQGDRGAGDGGGRDQGDPGAGDRGGRDPGERSPDVDGPHAAAMHYGPAHTVVYANPAFVEAFGGAGLGMPAREVMVGLPTEAFVLMDRVLRDGRPLARQIRFASAARRLVVVPRVDPESKETYGVTTHIVAPGWRGAQEGRDEGESRARGS